MKRLFFLVLAALAIPAWVSADQPLQYEPSVVEVSGTLVKGKQEHPNGTWFDFLLLKLPQPMSIKGDGEADSINVSEDHITEIQVSSADEALLKKVWSMKQKKMTLKGTLFHSHTAWHVRELVLMVTAIE